jgi:hypothetical protein
VCVILLFQVFSTGSAQILGPVIVNVVIVFLAVVLMYALCICVVSQIIFLTFVLFLRYLLSAYYQRKLTHALSAFQDGEASPFVSISYFWLHYNRNSSDFQPFSPLLEGRVHVDGRGAYLRLFQSVQNDCGLMTPFSLLILPAVMP